MKVKDLIKLLRTVDSKREVILQRDAEGNGYSPMCGYWQGAFLVDGNWGGEAGIDKLSEDDIADGLTEEDVLKGGVPAVFLVPVQ